MMRLILLLISGYFIVVNRYRLMNVMLQNTWLRKTIISTMMQFPFFRDRMTKQFL